MQACLLFFKKAGGNFKLVRPMVKPSGVLCFQEKHQKNVSFNVKKSFGHKFVYGKTQFMYRVKLDFVIK